MKIVRWLAALAAAAGLLQAGAASAQSYPNKPIKLIVPFGPGSGSDILARILAEPLTQAVGQPIIIENKPGNNTTLGTELVVQAAPDGYTLGLLTNSGLAASPAGLTSGVRYDPAKDLSYIAMVASVNYVWLVNPDVGAKTAGELVALIKANPGKFNYASGNTGGIAYGGYLKNAHQLDVTHVPYKSTPPALADLIRRARADHGGGRARFARHDPGREGPSGRRPGGKAIRAVARGADVRGNRSGHAAQPGRPGGFWLRPPERRTRSSTVSTGKW